MRSTSSKRNLNICILSASRVLRNFKPLSDWVLELVLFSYYLLVRALRMDPWKELDRHITSLLMHLYHHIPYSAHAWHWYFFCVPFRFLSVIFFLISHTQGWISKYQCVQTAAAWGIFYLTSFRVLTAFEAEHPLRQTTTRPWRGLRVAR